ncbi:MULTISPECIES: hypothetical protein [Moorena]|uniref:Uncharacterized protein n=2 Tax=Moorena producens TaxID=1155739 RepID=A0A1D9G4M9_MOOP1|nr:MULTISPECIES: hypothetical protein [Moorena]AOY82566.1 hypothetical protein BJP36_24270 [Moorena producens JHB]EGJ33613.1 hypothetical protein LYNGBM3L_28690 [Moorena producens 3L]NEP68917.1 hypothetical protein [Moorena sp. SIO3A5]NES46070.1 hypothetical protein [Moorena sp. SIO2C4]NET67730.1 hypothetical protein [Moorena sp. SIO1G6]
MEISELPIGFELLSDEETFLNDLDQQDTMVHGGCGPTPQTPFILCPAPTAVPMPEHPEPFPKCPRPIPQPTPPVFEHPRPRPPFPKPGPRHFPRTGPIMTPPIRMEH